MPNEGSARVSARRRGVVAVLSVLLAILVASPSWGRSPARDIAPAELLCAKGIASYRARRFSLAVVSLRRALRQGGAPAATGHYLGLALLHLGKRREGRRALARAARVDPHNVRLSIDLARAELLVGSPRRAVALLRRARALAPRRRELDYLLGVALLRLGRGREALSALSRARPGRDVDAAGLRLRRALAAVLARRWGEARHRLQGLLSGSRSSLARQLLRASYEAQGTAASFLSASVSLGMVVDSNPLYEHEVGASPGMGPSFGVALALRPWIDGRDLVWGEAAARRVSYFALGDLGGGMDPGAGSFTDFRVGLFYSRQLPRTLRLSLGYRFGVTLLDAPPPLADEHHIFAESHAGILALSFGDGRRASTQLRLTVSRDVYAIVARSAIGDELWFEHRRMFWGSRLRLLAWATARYDVARANRYDALSVGGGAGLSYRGPWAMVLGGRGGYRFVDYYASGGAYSTQPTALHVITPHLRLDHVGDLMVELSRSFPWGLRLAVAYHFLRNISSVTSFDYSRHLATFDVSWSGS